MKAQSMPHEAAAVRRQTYVSPCLTKLGNLSALVRGSGSQTNEGSSMMTAPVM
jgi:hypothetical protein